MSGPDFEKISDLEKTTLLRWFFYHLGWEERRRLMVNFPLTYERLFPKTGEAVVRALKEEFGLHEEEKEGES